MLITIGLETGSEGVTLDTIPRKLIVLVVESLPLVLRVTVVSEAILMVKLLDPFQAHTKFVKVESGDSLDLSTVEQH